MSDTHLRALLGTPDAPELVFIRRYAADRADVRDALTNPERLARWFGRVEGKPARVGDSFRAVLSEDDADDVATGRVLLCESDEIRVSWSWPGERDSVVTARLSDASDGGTTLTLQHALDEADHAVDYGGGWEVFLRDLASMFADPTGRAARAQVEEHAVAAWRTITGSGLELVRHVPAPVATVWNAFATADGMRRWWWNHWSDVEIDVDPRPGGAWRTAAPSQDMEVGGVYLTVDEPHRLTFTWEWTDAEGASINEAVDLRFVSEGDGTRLTVRHTGPWEDSRPAESYRQGWEFTLAALDEAISS